jgi:DNA-binding SARP family transcriptional activator
VAKFNILGPVVVEARDRVVEIKGALRRILLIALLVAEGRLVPVESLIEELWASSPPQNVENALQAHVSRLRRSLELLEPERPVPRLELFSTGYRLAADPDEIDISAFLRALEEVRQNPAMAPQEAVRRLRSALSLWRGEPFGGVSGGQLCSLAAARYQESRTTALELLFDYELRLGRHSAIVPELSELVRAAPLNERLCEQLMVALYRSGRQTDALALYRQMRSRLNEELGVEPSPALQAYERAILGHHPILAVRADHLALRMSA